MHHVDSPQLALRSWRGGPAGMLFRCISYTALAQMPPSQTCLTHQGESSRHRRNGNHRRVTFICGDRWRPATRLAARCGLAVSGGRTRGRKRRRAPTASPLNATESAAEEHPLRPAASAARLPLTVCIFSPFFQMINMAADVLSYVSN